MGDYINRQEAIDALEREKTYSRAYNEGYTQTDPFEQYNMGLIDGIKALKRLPSAQLEPSIPLSWFDGQIERLKGLDNAFATLTAMQILGMVKKWSDEQDG